MSNRPNLALAITFIVTTAVSIGGFWAVSKFFQGSIPITNNPSEPAKNPGEIKLLGDTFSGYSTFRNGTFLESLKGAGIKLDYADEFDQAKRVKLLNDGQSDLIVTTLDRFIKQKPKGKIVGLIDRTIGADAVVLNTPKYPKLKSLIDLNQLVQQRATEKLKITFAGDTPSEYLAFILDTKFEAFNLADFEVSKVTDASEAWKLLQDPSQNVAIAVIWEPFVTQAKQKGYTVVLSSKDAPTTIVDVLVASDRLMQSQPELLTKLLEAYYRRIDANRRDTSQLQAQIAQDGKLQPNDAMAVLRGIDFFTAIEAKRWMTDDTLSKRIGATAAVLSLAGQLEQIPIDTKELYTAQFLNKAAENTQVLVDLVRANDPELAERLAGRKANTTTQLSATQIRNAQSIGNLQIRGEVKFSSGSAELPSQSQQTLDRLVKEIGEFSTQTVAVRVIGHTSQTGDAQTNQILSQARAQVVVNYLRNRGVANNIVAEGKGFSQILPNIPPNDARNQRTEIRLVRVQ